MSFWKKYKAEIIILSSLLGIYLILRLLNILSLPIFTDEAIYVRWAQIAKNDAAWRFISLTDGKQPMLIWVTMTLMRFVKDPLLAGRLASVLGGFASTIGLYFLSRELFKNKWIGLLSAGIYVFLPFTLVYDRMALEESLVCTFLIGALYVEVLLVRRLQSYLPFVAGLLIGGGMLNKTTNFWSVYFLPFLLLLFDYKKQGLWSRLFKFVSFSLLAAVLAYLYYSVLRLSPYFGIIAEKNLTFYYSFSDWIKHPIEFFTGNLRGMVDWLITYINWISIFLVLISFITLRKFWKEKIFLLLWFIVPFLIFALIAKVLYPRYVLYMTIFLIPLVAAGLYGTFALWKKQIITMGLIILLALSYLYVDRFILFDFSHAPIPQPDLNQYINDWPSGGGVKEAVAFFKQEARNKKIYIGTEGTFGLMPAALEMYLVDNPNITIKGFWPMHATIPEEALKAEKTMIVYFLFYQPCLDCTVTGGAPPAWKAVLIKEYSRGISDKPLRIYQVK